MIKKSTLFAFALGVMVYASSCQKEVEQVAHPVLDEAAAATFADEDGMITTVERFEAIAANAFMTGNNISLSNGNWNIRKIGRAHV